MITPTRLSYAVLAATIILAGFFHLGVPLLVVLFSYFALRQLYFFTRRKWLALALFVVVVAGIAAAGIYVTRAAILALPDVADTSIPSANAWAQKRQIELPFWDFEVLDKASSTRLARKRITCETWRIMQKALLQPWFSASWQSWRPGACFSKQGSTRTEVRIG